MNGGSGGGSGTTVGLADPAGSGVRDGTWVVDAVVAGEGRAATGPLRIRVVDGTIAEITGVGPGRAASGPRLLCVPLLVNGHDHGRGDGLTSAGVADGPLESWIGRLREDRRPQFELVHRAAVGMLAAGIGAAVLCVNPTGPDVEAEMRIAYDAVRRAGIRAALVYPIADLADRRLGRDRHAAGWTAEETDRHLDAVARLVEELADPRVEVQVGPVGPQWVSEAVLERVAAFARDRALRLHMHLLESPAQRDWADRTYPDGLVRRLDELGLLSERSWFAHGTHLRADEMRLLADRGCGLTLNASSNLRLCSGVAPVDAARATLPRVAMGLDGLALNEDHDPWTELRLLRGIGQGQAHVPVPADWLVGTGTATGALGAAAPGRVEVGARADFVIVDVGGYGHLLDEGSWPAGDVLVAVGTAERVREVWVDGTRVHARGTAVEEGRA